MIYVVQKTKWQKTIFSDNQLETSVCEDKDIVYIGTKDLTKCLDYAETESVKDNEKSLYHIYYISPSKCNFMSFTSGLSHHTHLEKMILYRGNVMIRNSTLSDNTLIFDKELRKIDSNFNKDIQTFRLILSYK
jgi:hypothetical protein